VHNIQESSKQKAVLHVKMEDSRQASQEEQEERRIQEVAKAKGKELRVLSWKNMAVNGTRHHRHHAYMVAFCCQFRQGKFLYLPGSGTGLLECFMS
jgi:hypothetical protein